VNVGTDGILYFDRPEDFRAWLHRHHTNTRELVVGFYKKSTGRQSITWPEAVDEALCYGWIDGIRRRVDDDSYSVRFTPRKARSTWSAVNVARVDELTRAGRMTEAGRAAFEARSLDRTAIYSYEQRSGSLGTPFEERLNADEAALIFWHAQSPSYRKAASWWVVSAKREETRERRFEQLVRHCAAGLTLPQFTRAKSN
jgi:uncharacterized protein YdeI (YjbR/CyaY-like superfamily)